MCRYWRSSLPLINCFSVIYKIILSVSKNAPTVGASFFCFIKDTADHIGAFLLLGLIQMGIDIGVIVDHCTGRHGFQLVQIKALNVLGLDSVQRQSSVSEIRCNLSLYHLRVRGKSGLFRRAADNLQPQQRLRAGISCISTAAASCRRTVISFIGVLSPFLRRKNAEQTWNGIKFGSASVRLA